MIGICALATASVSNASAQDPSTFRAVNLNHLALAVTDIPRSRDFYVRHLGLTPAREDSNSCFLNFGDNFLALFRQATPGLDHYCYGIEDYTVDSAAEKLKNQEITPEIQGSRIYFQDPDGITVQLASAGHRA